MQTAVNRRQIALLHVAKTQLGLSEEVYRAMLASVGVLSSTELNGRQFDEIMRRFEAGGFKSISTKSHEGKQSHTKSQELRAKSPRSPARARQLGKIDRLIETMNLPRSYADGIARQMWGSDKVDWCTPRQLRGVIAALVKRRQRMAAEGHKEDGNESSAKG